MVSRRNVLIGQGSFPCALPRGGRARGTAGSIHSRAHMPRWLVSVAAGLERERRVCYFFCLLQMSKPSRQPAAYWGSRLKRCSSFFWPTVRFALSQPSR